MNSQSKNSPDRLARLVLRCVTLAFAAAQFTMGLGELGLIDFHPDHGTATLIRLGLLCCVVLSVATGRKGRAQARARGSR